MGTSIVALKDEFASQQRKELFRDVLSPYRLPVAAWQAGFMSVFEQDSYLMNNTDIQSVMSSATTIAVLGLRMDKATGQSCIVPFAGKAQPIVMVQGYTTIAARSGFVMQSRLIREGDTFKELGGSTPGIMHEPLPNNRGKVIATYAIARSQQHPTLFSPIMYLDEIIAVRDRSQGYKSALNRGKKHPWMTDFDAMMLKTPKRRLQKDIPNDQLAQAAWLDTMHDIGRLAYLNPDGRPVESQAPMESDFPERQPGITDVVDLTEQPHVKPKIQWATKLEGEPFTFQDIAHWQRWMTENIGRASADQKERLAGNLERNGITMTLFKQHWPAEVKVVLGAYKAKGVDVAKYERDDPDADS